MVLVHFVPFMKFRRRKPADGQTSVRHRGHTRTNVSTSSSKKGTLRGEELDRKCHRYLKYKTFHPVRQGDSGGPVHLFDPLLARYVIVGTVKGGGGCGVADLPSVNTRLVPFLPWIESVIKQ